MTEAKLAEFSERAEAEGARELGWSWLELTSLPPSIGETREFGASFASRKLAERPARGICATQSDRTLPQRRNLACWFIPWVRGFLRTAVHNSLAVRSG
jgi:hypothetical protein